MLCVPSWCKTRFNAQGAGEFGMLPLQEGSLQVFPKAVPLYQRFYFIIIRTAADPPLFPVLNCSKQHLGNIPQFVLHHPLFLPFCTWSPSVQEYVEHHRWPVSWVLLEIVCKIISRCKPNDSDDCQTLFFCFVLVLFGGWGMVPG